MEISKQDEQDFYDFWHLKYDGELSLEEFMKQFVEWSDMPTYVFECEYCKTGEFEKNVPMDERDHQWCDKCGIDLERKIRFTGRVWAPTAGGTR